MMKKCKECGLTMSLIHSRTAGNCLAVTAVQPEDLAREKGGAIKRLFRISLIKRD